MKEYRTIYMLIDIEHLQTDPDQPRKIVEVDKAMLNSIKSYGIQYPPVVVKISEKLYKILDGHRRHMAAGELGMKQIWCKVYLDPLTPLEEEIIRYQAQNVRRNWTPSERGNSIFRIQQQGKLKQTDIATLLKISATIVTNSVNIRNLKQDYSEKFYKYGLNESFKLEFVRLRPKLIKIKNFQIPYIETVIFEKIQRKIIKSSKEVRKLGRVFSRATANEKELFNFLSDPDMTVNDLDNKTIVSGFSFKVLQLTEDLKARRAKGMKKYEPKEQVLVDNLKKLL